MGNVLMGAEKESGAQVGENVLAILSEATLQEGSLKEVEVGLATGTSGRILESINGNEQLVVYQPLDLNDWTIVSVVDASVVDEPVGLLLSRMYVLAGIILIAAIGLIALAVNQIKQQNNELIHNAEHDVLTGMLNRDAFVRRAEAVLRTATPGTYLLCSVNISNFKTVNDQFGHDQGDRLLRWVGEYLARDAHEHNGLSCRDYADHFLALRSSDHEDFERSAEEGIETLSRYDLPIHLELTAGIYPIDDPTMSVGAMIERALVAQHMAKDPHSSNIARYDEAVWHSILHKQALVGDMHRALENREFEVHMQPQYNIASNTIISAEALVRWNHPQWGMVPPDEFIPLFEENGFISQLDAWVREEACAHMSAWQRRGNRCIPLSVNVSRIEMQDANIVEALSSLTDRHQLDRSLLRLEITEGTFADAPHHIIELAEDLHEQGFYIEMDDFGKGYSCLNSLKDLPIDMIKLDMRFISSSDLTGRGNAIIVSVMSMARLLGLDVIAEGVETEEQAAYLQSVGCTLAQGYYYARPMPIDQFEALLAEEQRKQGDQPS